MPKSRVFPETRRILFFSLSDAQKADMLAFLRRLSSSLRERLRYSEREEGLLVDYSRAPKVWALTEGLQQGSIAARVTGRKIGFYRAKAVQV
jgi:hypothetical protein